MTRILGQRPAMLPLVKPLDTVLIGLGFALQFGTVLLAGLALYGCAELWLGPPEGWREILKRAALSGAAGAAAVLIGAMVVYARRGGR